MKSFAILLALSAIMSTQAFIVKRQTNEPNPNMMTTSDTSSQSGSQEESHEIDLMANYQALSAEGKAAMERQVIIKLILDDHDIEKHMMCLTQNEMYCDKIGKFLKVKLPKLLNGECEGCTLDKRLRIALLIRNIQVQHPDGAKRLKELYAPDLTVDPVQMILRGELEKMSKEHHHHAQHHVSESQMAQRRNTRDSEQEGQQHAHQQHHMTQEQQGYQEQQTHEMSQHTRETRRADGGNEVQTQQQHDHQQHHMTRENQEYQQQNENEMSQHTRETRHADGGNEAEAQQHDHQQHHMTQEQQMYQQQNEHEMSQHTRETRGADEEEMQQQHQQQQTMHHQHESQMYNTRDRTENDNDDHSNH